MAKTEKTPKKSKNGKADKPKKKVRIVMPGEAKRHGPNDKNVTIHRTGTLVKANMIEYGSFVIEDRAVPDFRDGLKPSQRRILYTMRNDLKLAHTGHTVKCAKIVGGALGNYHPHGDSSVYGALVGMYHQRYRLIQPRGNFGNELDSESAYRYCFVAGTLVETDRGLVRIEDIPKVAGSKSRAKKQSIAIGVSSLEGIETTSKWYNLGEHDVVSVSTKLGHNNTCTPNQPFLVLNKNLDFVWKTTEELAVGERIAVSRSGYAWPESNAPIAVDDTSFRWRDKRVETPHSFSLDFAELLGLLISDGSFSEYEIGFGNTDKALVNRFVALLKELFPGISKYITRRTLVTENKPCYYANVNNVYVVDYMKAIGVVPFVSGTAAVPDLVLRASKVECRMFLSAFFAGDGGCSTLNYGAFIAVSKSRALLEVIKVLLLRFGVVCYDISVNRKYDSASEQDNTIWQLRTSSEESAKAFYTNVGILKSEKAKVADGYWRGRELCTTSFAHTVGTIPSIEEYIDDLIASRKAPGRPGSYYNDNHEVVRLAVGDLSRAARQYRKWDAARMSLLEKLSASSALKVKTVLSRSFVFDTITAIEKLPTKQVVYDITVPTTHAFVANGVIAHNTEARLTKMSIPIFACEDVMDKVDNFDGTTKEPLVINARVPLMLMNGAEGIAVGLSVAIPSHNLGELVGALKYVVKNFKTVTIEDVMQFVKGPDFRNGGRLLSKAKDIAEVYRNGYGPIETQCEYNVGRDDEGRTTIEIIGFPDEFSVSGFINACAKMQDSGDVYAVETDFINSRYKEVSIDGRPIKTHRIMVTLSNKKGMDAVVRKLNCRRTYQFYTTQRNEDGIALKSYNFLDILKHWVRWRRKEETKMLELDLKKAKRSLWCEETRLAAMLNVQVIADALKQEKLEFVDYLVKHLKVTKEQAEFIADLKVGNLRKANIGDQKKRIAEIKKQIGVIEDDLQHINRVVLKHLEALTPYFDDRRTIATGRAQSTAKLVIERTGDPTVMLASRDGKLFTNVTEKGSTTADVIATASYEGSVIFDETGLTQIMSITECDGKAGPAYKNIVGIASHEAQHLLVIGKNGNALKMSGADAHKQKEFTSLKGVPVIAGFGVHDNSNVLVFGKKHGEFACIKASKIKEMRKNTAGAKLVSFKPVRALVVHENQFLFTDEGSRIQPAKAGDIVDNKIKLFVISERNIVIYKTGRRKFMDRAATVKELARDSAAVRFVYSVSAADLGGSTPAPAPEPAKSVKTTKTTGKKKKKVKKPAKAVKAKRK